MSVIDQILYELDGFLDRDGDISPEALTHAAKITALLAQRDPEQALLVLKGFGA
ncbi:MAG: hypothetical protein JWR11_892 [Mycobacterium sp.]|nr:hypothetical protein [Mycobacterium sp.]